MVFSNFTIKSVLIIVNCFNITCALIHITVTILNYKNASENVDSMVMNYINMVISGVCCAAAFIGSTNILEITANIFLCEIVATVIVWIYVRSFCTYVLIALILHGIIAAIASLLTHRLRRIELKEMISIQATSVMMPLNPQSHGE